MTVLVEIADGGELVAAAEDAGRSGRIAEAAATVPGHHPGDSVGITHHEVPVSVPGHVRRGHHRVVGGPPRGHLATRPEAGQPPGRDHERPPVGGSAHQQVGAAGRRQVGLPLPARPVLLGGRRVGPDHRQLGVEVPPRAGGRGGVAVPVDRRERGGADPLPGRVGRDPVQRQLPGEQRTVGPEHGVGGAGGLVVADGRHRERVVVVAQGVGADDGAIHAAVPALPDPTEPVDQEVVADVAPAARPHVVGVDPAQQRGHLGAGVVVRVDRVVDEAGMHLVVVQRTLLADRLVRAPLRPGEDLGLGGVRRRTEGELAGGGLHGVVGGRSLGPVTAQLGGVDRGPLGP